MSFHLLIEDQGLVLSAILVPFDSHWFMLRASLIAHLINHLPAMQEGWDGEEEAGGSPEEQKGLYLLLTIE